MPANKSQVRFLFTLLAIVWGFLVGANSLLAGWSTPTAVPPGNNPVPFLSTDNTSQTKTGVLTIGNNFYVIGSGSTGKVGIGTSTNETSARLMVEPYTDASIDAGTGYIRTGYYPLFGTDVVNKNYLESAIDVVKYWTLLGDNLYTSSTTYSVAIGTTTAGTAKLAVIGGNVGIGTTNPGTTSATGLSAPNQVLELKTAAGTYINAIYLRRNDNATGLDITNEGAGTGIVYLDSRYNSGGSGGFQFRTNTAGTPQNSLRLDGNGNVGIGTTTPNSRLFVRGLGSASTTSALNIQNSSGVSSLFVRNDGYVGVRTTTPGANLHVNGNAIADTPLAANHLATKSYVDAAAQSLWVNSGEYLYASSTSWRVGIGTTSPASALHIYPQNNIEGLRVVSSNYSPLVIMSSSSVNLFRVDESGKARSSAYCDINGNNCFNPSSGWSSDSYFVTTTPLTYNGSQGGYVAANLLCNAVVAGSHVCTTGEILNTINFGYSERIPVDSNGFWFYNGPPGYTVNVNDCLGFTSNSHADFGTIWIRRFLTDQGSGSINFCDEAKKFACCK